MGLTNFPNGISSFGIPVFGSGGFVTQGNVWFVKPSSGADGNTGDSPDRALKTLSRAHTLATANQNDIVFLFAESNTAASTTDYQAATLTWSKDLVHLVGVCAPTLVSQRARIANTASTVVSPVLDVTADGCYFANLQVINENASASSLLDVRVTGTRNVFENVHFAGIADATMSAAGSCSLKIDGGAENLFKHCTIGLDTIARDADATEILLDGAATRNVFEDCNITSYISAAGFASVTIADTTGIDRYLLFRNCFFMTKSTNKTVDQTEVFNIPAGISQGAIALMDCAVLNDGGAPVWTAGTEGILWANMIAPTAAAAGGFMTNL